jgi:hypothetical protein
LTVEVGNNGVNFFSLVCAASRINQAYRLLLFIACVEAFHALMRRR